MSTTKVNNSAPVGRTSAQMMKLGAISASSASASVVGVADSGGVGTPTEQYLQNQNLPNMPMAAQQAAVEVSAPVVMTVVMAPETGTVYSANMGRDGDDLNEGYKSTDIGHKIESYEKVIEAIEIPVEKVTQGFG
ncbi:MAG: hypothetical protein MJ250_04650 [Alphaproteobacteria bacterium]|nr:hypothetical protein [Alphaproteobacteria bacterium]